VGFCTYQKVLIKRVVANAEASGRDQEFLGITEYPSVSRNPQGANKKNQLI